MSDPNESVAALYRREVGRLFAEPAFSNTNFGRCIEIRERYRPLAEWLTDAVPPCPELWRGVQELYGSLLLCEAAVMVNPGTVPLIPTPRSIWPKGMRT
jgi:hypothetical protein